MFEAERLLVQNRRLPQPCPFPCCNIGIMLIVAQCLAFRGAALLAKVGAAGLFAVERVDTHQLGEFDEVANPPRLLQRLIEFLPRAHEQKIVPELLA